MAWRSKGNPRMTWGQLKEWVGWRGNKSLRKLVDGQGQITRNPNKMANILANYYGNKVKKIREKLGNKNNKLTTTTKNERKQRSARIKGTHQ